MTRARTRRNFLKASLVMGAGGLAACKEVSFPTLNPEFVSGVSETPEAVVPRTELASQPSVDVVPEPVTINAVMHDAPFGGAFPYEVQRTEGDWRTRLTPAEYKVLRQGRTEPKNSHPYVTETEPGTYHCKGCDLPVYGSEHKTILTVGWVFFEQSLDNALMLSMDQGRIEGHCRRCGSHLGHVLVVPAAGRILHCVNGVALSFDAAAA